MSMRIRRIYLPALALLTACAAAPSQQQVDAGSGPNPALPQPQSKAIPVVNIAPAKIFVPFANGRPSGQPEEILTGFVDGEQNALGRPVGVAVDGRGALLVADDVGNRIWRVTPGERELSSR